LVEQRRTSFLKARRCWRGCQAVTLAFPCGSLGVEADEGAVGCCPSTPSPSFLGRLDQLGQRGDDVPRPVEVVPETAEQWETARWVGRVKSPTSNRAK
jgi:hypothetical protein